MIKFRYTQASGQQGFGFGLSVSNIQRLQRGEPIAIDLAELGGTGHVMIFSGQTEMSMMEQLEEFLGPKTVVHISDRLKA